MAIGLPAMNARRTVAGTMALLASSALAASAAAPAGAAAPPSPKPATFALTAVGAGGPMLVRGTAGGAVRGEVRVRNVSRRSITVRLQAADIRNATNGNADYVTTRLSRTGRWVRLGAKSVRLAPRATRRVPFTVQIPAGARGASHYAGIVGVDAADLAAAAASKGARGRRFTFARVNRQALPLTVRLPGPLSRRLALRSAKLTVQPAGAGLVLGLRPGGTELIQGARIRLRVLRGSRTVFGYASTLGQMLPGTALNHRIPWVGRPREGSYRVLGVIRPHRAAAVHIDEMVEFTPAGAAELKQETAPAPGQPAQGIPSWVWLALVAAAALLLGLSAAVWKLARRPAVPVA
jgi:hypothetical protein